MLRNLLTRQYLCGLILIATTPVHAITIDLLPTLQEVDTNAMLSVDLTVSELGDAAAPSLGGFDLNIFYDPAILAFSGSSALSFGGQLDLFGLGSIQSVEDSTPGVINLFELSLDPAEDVNNLQLSSFTLATLTFDTLLEGTTFLTVEINTLGDANGDPLHAAPNGAQINVIPSTDVPEPATLLLLTAGVAGLGWRRHPQRHY